MRATETNCRTLFQEGYSIGSRTFDPSGGDEDDQGMSVS